MSRKFLVGIDLNKNELSNAVIQNLATAPATPLAGQIYFNTTDDTLYFYDGTVWVDFVQQSTIAADTYANRPAASSGNAGTLFFATDYQILYYSNGSAWSQISAFGSVTAQTTYGATSGNGSANSYSRSDHTHGTPSLSNGTPTANAVGQAGSAGTGTAPSRDDHQHAGPGFGSVTSQTSFGASSADGTATTVAHSDHTHGTPTLDTSAIVGTGVTVSDLDAPTADLAMGANKITGLANPTADQDAATKYYVDNAVQGLTWKQAANLLADTNAPLTGSTGSLTIDNHLLNATTDGYRIVLTNQTTASEEGIYVYNDSGSGYTLTRSTDGTPYTELIGATIFIEEGTIWANSIWTQANHYITSFASQSWVQVAAPIAYTGGDGIDVTGTVITAVAATGGGITVDGSGISVDTSVVARKYSTNVGDGSNDSITITHNLGTRDVIVNLYDNASPYAEVTCDVAHTTTNTVTLAFSVAPTSNQYRVVVIG